MVTKQLDAIAVSAHTDAPLVKEAVPVTDSMPPTSVTPWRKMLSRTAVFGIGRAFSPRGGRVVYALRNLGSYLDGTVLDVGAGANAAVSARPRRVVHFEPTTERLRPWHPQDWLIFLHVHGRNYQRTLFGVLERRAREGRIRILHQERLGIAPILRNEGFVIVWEPL